MTNTHADIFANSLNELTEVKWMVITPEIAQDMLTHNTNNYRKLSKKTVEQYVTEIKNGSWAANGDTIVFDSEGVLLNGQHRLSAVVEANESIVSLVVRGIPNSQVFDVGKRRSDRLILRSEGYDYVDSTIISTVTALLRGFDTRTTKVTLSDIREVVKNESDLLIKSRDLVDDHDNGRLGVTRKASVAVAVFCALKNDLIEPSKIQQVFSVANSGFPIEGLNSSPGLALRMSLQENSNGKWSAEARYYAYNSTMQAFIDYKNGVERKQIYRDSKKYENLFNVTRQIVIADIGKVKEAV